jgi:hypothetical protein
MDSYSRERKGDPRSRRSLETTQECTKDFGVAPEDNLFGDVLLTGASEGEDERTSPLRGEISYFRELPGWSIQLQESLELLSESASIFSNVDAYVQRESTFPQALFEGLAKASTADRLVATGRDWISTKRPEVTRAWSTVKAAKAFVDSLDTTSYSIVKESARQELLVDQELYYRKPTLTPERKRLMVLSQGCMAVGWLACVGGTTNALNEFVGIDFVPSLFAALTLSSALTVATKILVPQGKPSRSLCWSIFILTVVACVGISTGAGLIKPADTSEYEQVEPTTLPLDAFVLGGVCLADLSLMLGLTCVARSLAFSASSFAQFKPSTRMFFTTSEMTNSYTASVAGAREELDVALKTFETTCLQIGSRLLENALSDLYGS